MATVVGVKFKKTNKIYYFNPSDVPCEMGDAVVVETTRGSEIGDIVMPPMELDDDKIVAPLKNVLRKVNEADLEMASQNKGREEDALRVFGEKILEYGLEMKPVDVDFAFDGSKITFYFTADGRVDFRELVKGLAHHFRSRIELRQIGVRDEAKMLGGLGKCGFPICCERFMTNFTPVSIKMAKEQNISLNPNKISGLCGRLMCCLNYEHEYYAMMRKKMPNVGSRFLTHLGTGTVLENNYLSGKVKVRVERSDGVIEVIDVPFDGQNDKPDDDKTAHGASADGPNPTQVTANPGDGENPSASAQSAKNTKSTKKRRGRRRRRSRS